jgi:hypothetical protein
VKGKSDSSNVVERLSLCESLLISGSSELEYLSRPLFKVDGNVLKRLSRGSLTAVIQSDRLRIPPEDGLLDFILELGNDHFDLLGCLRAE